MLATRSALDATVGLVGAGPEALMKEARRRRRRRWATRLLVGAVLLGGAAAVGALTISGTRSPFASAGAAAGALPTGRFASLDEAGPLAVARDGTLYVTNG